MTNLFARSIFAALILSLGIFRADAAQDWKPAAGPLMTKWAKDVSPKNVHKEYPRPQMVREEWQNLNGLWDYAITEKEATTAPTKWNGKILVPFPIQSALSGVMTNVSENQRLWYSRKFDVPRKWRGKRVLLNFGAVDWDAMVWVNGKEVGKHQGGYDAFTFDITDALNAKGDNEIVVSVWDPTDGGPQPRGKQVRKPGGIWYTPTSGIWQTVWLEPVDDSYLQGIRINPDFDANVIEIELSAASATGEATFSVQVLDGGAITETADVVLRNAFVPLRKPGESKKIFLPGQPAAAGPIRARLQLRLRNAKPWTPEKPFLYGLRILLKQDNKTVDRVQSYFAMRKISTARDDKGRLRIQLNNTNYFQIGPLDQGFWPDGLYTAPTDEALRYDIKMTKKLGFNMARKHVKVEPERWYYWCDKLGLLVWQDMPSGDKSAKWKGPSGFDGEEMKRTPESVAIYEREWKAIVNQLYNHPCIVTWVPFNEGWGQFDTARILKWTKELDPTRLVDGASGGNHFPAGDIIDHHQYPGPGAPTNVTDRAMVLGEFGGLGLPVKGHTWQSEKNWGYRSFTNAATLTSNYVALLQKLQPMIEEKGLSAAIYTQTTDVEVEVNGLMTYDRAVTKMPVDVVSKANRFQFPPRSAGQK
jgi:beta-galactosidase/beta-glucuronidase